MNPSSPTDESLVEEVVAGDIDAFDLLYERYVSRIYRFVAPRLPESQAEDLTASIMTTLWKNLIKFDHRSSFSTWAFSVANNALKNWYRKNRKTYSLTILERLKLSPIWQRDDIGDDFEDIFAIRADFNKAFQKLPENYQSVLLLRIVEKMPADEVAVIMGLKNANAVACLLYRAKELFRQLYTDPVFVKQEKGMGVASAAGLSEVKTDV